jgi:hypothetical protein
MKPTRGASSVTIERWCSTSVGRAARRPPRTVAVNSALRRIRCADDSTSIKRRAGPGPCGAARSRWSDRPWCASADGSHASWPDAGCWAGTYASTRSHSEVRRFCLRFCGNWAGTGAAPVRQATQRPTVQRDGRCWSNWRRCARPADENLPPLQRFASGWGRHAAPPSLRLASGCGQVLDATGGTTVTSARAPTPLAARSGS